jgi:general stress protein YciG
MTNKVYPTPEAGRSRQGFASMSAEKLREISSMGGKAAHRSGKAHKWTREEAARAGRIGGLASDHRSKGRKRDQATQEGK